MLTVAACPTVEPSICVNTTLTVVGACPGFAMATPLCRERGCVTGPDVSAYIWNVDPVEAARNLAWFTVIPRLLEETISTATEALPLDGGIWTDPVRTVSAELPVTKRTAL